MSVKRRDLIRYMMELDLYRAAIAVFSRIGRSDERFKQQNAHAFGCRLRQLAYVCGKEMIFNRSVGPVM